MFHLLIKDVIHCPATCFVVRSQAAVDSSMQARDWKELRCVYNILLYLRLSARHIRLQQASSVMHATVWVDQGVTASFKLVQAVNRIHDGSSTSSVRDCAVLC